MKFFLFVGILKVLDEKNRIRIRSQVYGFKDADPDSYVSKCHGSGTLPESDILQRHKMMPVRWSKHEGLSSKCNWLQKEQIIFIFLELGAILFHRYQYSVWSTPRPFNDDNGNSSCAAGNKNCTTPPTYLTFILTPPPPHTKTMPS